MKPELLSPDIIKAVKQDTCFDFLRYLFAISLILAHFCTLTDSGDFGLWKFVEQPSMNKYR